LKGKKMAPKETVNSKVIIVGGVAGGMLSLTHTHLLSQVEPGMPVDAA
jgi:hypothetical protein